MTEWTNEGIEEARAQIKKWGKPGIVLDVASEALDEITRLRAELDKRKQIIADFVGGFEHDVFGVRKNGNEWNGIDEGEVNGTKFLIELLGRANDSEPPEVL